MSRYRRLDAGLKRHDYAATLDEVGRELGVTRERARQIESKALRKAKAILTKHGYRLEDLLPERDRHPEGGDL